MSRLIDADALRKRIKAKNASNAMMKAMREECVAEIDDAPTIEPKKGKWVRTYRNGFGTLIGRCGVCGRTQTVDNFCQNCGARMEEGEVDE